MDPLANVGELETHLQRDLDDQAGANFALSLASGAVRAYCGWDLAREETTFHVDGSGTQVLTLPTLHLLDVTEIRASGNVLDVTGTDDLIKWSRKGQIYRAGGWHWSANLEVDVIHGYDPIPDLLKLVTLDLAAKNLNNPEGLISATVGQVSKTWATSGGNAGGSMSTLHERLLDRYSL